MLVVNGQCKFNWLSAICAHLKIVYTISYTRPLANDSNTHVCSCKANYTIHLRYIYLFMRLGQNLYGWIDSNTLFIHMRLDTILMIKLTQICIFIHMWLPESLWLNWLTYIIYSYVAGYNLYGQIDLNTLFIHKWLATIFIESIHRLTWTFSYSLVHSPVVILE